MMTAEEVIKLLSLEPHPEGGYYRESYRSDEIIRDGALPIRYTGDKGLARQFITY